MRWICWTNLKCLNELTESHRHRKATGCNFPQLQNTATSRLLTSGFSFCEHAVKADSSPDAYGIQLDKLEIRIHMGVAAGLIWSLQRSRSCIIAFCAICGKQFSSSAPPSPSIRCFTVCSAAFLFLLTCKHFTASRHTFVQLEVAVQTQ
jgi:hypothetical protein